MKSTILSFALCAILLSGCANNTETGALVGAGLGAGTGALISPTPAGVLIGAGVGAAAGALVGSALDNQDKENLQQNSPKTMKKVDRGEQLSINDIKKMSEVGITDDKIIGTIQSTGSVFHLTTSDVEGLKKAGVSERVINYMLQTAYE